MVGLTSFVAINTLVFLGLALAKAVPWPEPIPPSVLRALTNRRRNDAGSGIPPVGNVTIPQKVLLALVVFLAR